MMYFNIAKFMKNNILNSGLCLALGMRLHFLFLHVKIGLK